MIGLLACFIPLFICFFVLLFKFKLKITHLLLAILFGLIAILPISFIQYFIPDFKLLFTNQIVNLHFYFNNITEKIQDILLYYFNIHQVPTDSGKSSNIIASLVIGCIISR